MGVFKDFKALRYFDKETLPSLENKDKGNKITLAKCYDDVFQEWKRKWNGDDIFDEDRLFVDVFCASYNFTKTKIEKNAKLNFNKKDWFKLVLEGYALLQAFLLVVAFLAHMNLKSFPFTAKQFSIANTITIELILFVLVMTILLIITKEINVRKYQETWARHEFALYQYRQAMMDYLDAYVDNDNNDVAKTKFKQKIYRIMRENEEKFTNNMESKEKGMMEDIESIIGSIKK